MFQVVHDIDVIHYLCWEDRFDYKAKQVGMVKEVVLVKHDINIQTIKYTLLVTIITYKYIPIHPHTLLNK